MTAACFVEVAVICFNFDPRIRSAHFKQTGGLFSAIILLQLIYRVPDLQIR